MTPEAFREIVWEKGRRLYRPMPWRDQPTLYHVLVSELMLQQTQVSRAIVKYAEFMQAFPSLEALAEASLAEVLRVWQGLGYNRRAKYLHQAARQIVAQGEPTTLTELVALPGIGKNTAGAMMNYVYQVPTAFVETNIRSVYFYYFFANRTDVPDSEVHAVVEETMDQEHPREWFWALMDVGAWLKSQGQARLSTSRHYKKQPPLKGSVREVRGQIIHVLTGAPSTLKDYRHELQDEARFTVAVQGLQQDGLIVEVDGVFRLTDRG